MQTIDDPERRLSAAMARIAAAAERLMEPPAAGGAAPEPDTAAEVEIARLSRVLDEAQGRNADLIAQIATVRERHSATSATLEGRLAEQSARIDGQAVELQRLRQVNVQLREALRSLREALEGGAADAGQINRALQAELDALRAARRSEVADLDLLLAALDPLLEGADREAAPAPQDTEADDARA